MSNCNGDVGSLNAKRRWLKKNPRRNVSLPAELHTEMKTQANNEDKSVVEFIEDLFKEYKAAV
jgi:hypothetical protein